MSTYQILKQLRDNPKRNNKKQQQERSDVDRGVALGGRRNRSGRRRGNSWQ